MIELGKYNDLEILRHTSVGLYLGDDAGEDVLLPNKYCPEHFEIGDTLNVFVYRDSEDRKIATNLVPKIKLHEFALMKVVAVNSMGAFLDWGLEKDLLVPKAEQRSPMVEGRSYVVYLELDEKSDRLYATSKIDRYLENEFLRVEEGEEVDLMVYHHSELGYSVIVNGVHEGLIYDNEVFKRLQMGDQLKGFIKAIRPGNKLDISIQPIGYEKFNDVNTTLLLNELQQNEGYLPFSDSSSPEEIYARFNISKKAFKKAIGALYKDRKITLEDAGIRLVNGEQ